MGHSFTNVNYRLRPAKNIERKMMAELIQRLVHINQMSEYHYIGMGSTYFSDFRIFHKRLGIDNMTSIEKAKGAEKRVKFNKPFDCIKIRIGHSNGILPELEWDQPTILWLDYDSRLKKSMFRDLQQFFSNAPVGSMIFITVNAEPHELSDLGDDETRLDRLKDEIGEDNVLRDISAKDLRRWDKAEAYRQIITEKVESDYLYPVNQGIDERDKIEFKQLVNFRYQDGMKMMTLGGLLYSQEISGRFMKASFEDLSFVKTDNDAFHITAPKLTFEEIRELDKKLPSDPTEIDIPVPDSDIKNYSDVYRYFPRFIESEI